MNQGGIHDHLGARKSFIAAMKPGNVEAPFEVDGITPVSPFETNETDIILKNQCDCYI